MTMVQLAENRSGAGRVEASPWFVVPRPVAAPRARLICFPYAGGAATVFHRWKQFLPKDVELLSVQLPGRGGRLRDPMYRRMEDLVVDLLPALQGYLDRPYALFGHSMGALIAFEVIRALPQEARPRHFFPSGRGAPHLPPVSALRLHVLDDDMLIEELRRMDGTPEQVLADPLLRAMVLPTLRADFEILETWRFRPEAPLDVPITAFGGDGDLLVSLERLRKWAEHTSAAFFHCVVPGGHFFLHSSPERILNRIRDSLSL